MYLQFEDTRSPMEALGEDGEGQVLCTYDHLTNCLTESVTFNARPTHSTTGEDYQSATALSFIRSSTNFVPLFRCFRQFEEEAPCRDHPDGPIWGIYALVLIPCHYNTGGKIEFGHGLV